MEQAAVYAIAEQNRSKGGGLLGRQQKETLVFISKIGYPLWLFPRNNAALIFNALDDTIQSMPYGETPSAAVFLESLQVNQRPRENYLAFLSDHGTYFQQPPKQRQFTFRGLITETDFKTELSVYRREATELTTPATLLAPILEETAISATLTELDNLQSLIREDQEKLPECIRLMKKTTSQYLTELDYEATAAKEEADAKIKAQEEFINPQIAKLNKEYNRKIKDLTASFDLELENLQKQKNKTEKTTESTEAKIRQYQQEAKEHGKKGHEIYEKRWKDKVKRTQNELSALKKELKNIENNTKKVSRQKGLDVSNLNFELDSAIKLARQPILQLESARDEKTLAFKRESNRLIALEKPIMEGIEKSGRLRETISATFDDLGLSDRQIRSPLLIYVPFYVVCYEAGLERRYLTIAPSTVSSIDFSAKLKGAFGISKTNDMLEPRFRAIAALIGKVEALTKQNSSFESKLWRLGSKNNLLEDSAFRNDVDTGLVYLKHAGWLSERETADLSNQIRA